jgi:hypothetical protein
MALVASETSLRQEVSPGCSMNVAVIARTC